MRNSTLCLYNVEFFCGYFIFFLEVVFNSESLGKYCIFMAGKALIM